MDGCISHGIRRGLKAIVFDFVCSENDDINQNLILSAIIIRDAKYYLNLCPHFSHM